MARLLGGTAATLLSLIALASLWALVQAVKLEEARRDGRQINDDDWASILKDAHRLAA